MCLDDQVLSSYIDGELQEPWKTQVEEHISHCKECRERYEEFARMDQTLFETRLSNDEFSMQQQRVWKYLEKTCMPAQPKKFRHKRIGFSAPAFAAAAAALVLLLGANVFLLTGLGTSGSADEFQIPTLTAQSEGSGLINGNGEEDSMISVSARTHRTSSIAPQELTVEELLVLLEQKGFEVELKRADAAAPVQSYGSSPAAQQELSPAALLGSPSEDDDSDEQEQEEPSEQEQQSDGWDDWNDD